MTGKSKQRRFYEKNLVLLLAVKDGDRVTISYAHHLACELKGRCREGEQQG